MSNNLPAKRGSRAVQREHVRRYKSGKVARVNKGNKKIVVRKTRFVSKPVSKPVIKGPVFSAVTKKGVIDNRKFSVGRLDAEYLANLRAKNELQDVFAKLDKDSYLAKDVKIITGGGWEQLVHFTDVKTGQRLKVIADKSFFNTNFINLINFCVARNIPLIFDIDTTYYNRVDNIGFLPSIEDMEPDFNQSYDDDDAIFDIDEAISQTPLNVRPFEFEYEADAYRKELLRKGRVVLMYVKFNDSGGMHFVEDHGPRNRRFRE